MWIDAVIGNGGCLGGEIHERAVQHQLGVEGGEVFLVHRADPHRGLELVAMHHTREEAWEGWFGHLGAAGDFGRAFSLAKTQETHGRFICQGNARASLDRVYRTNPVLSTAMDPLRAGEPPLNLAPAASAVGHLSWRRRNFGKERRPEIHR